MSRSDCADTGLSDAILVHAHICACPNKAAQSYRCSHMHLASNYYVVIKLAFFVQTTCVRQTFGKLTATSDLLSPLVITGNTLEGDVSDVIALDQLTSPFSSRKATRMSP